MSAMGGGEDSKPPRRPSSPSTANLKAARGPFSRAMAAREEDMSRDLMAVGARTEALAVRDLTAMHAREDWDGDKDCKETSTEVGRGDVPSSANLKAAGSAPGPSSSAKTGGPSRGVSYGRFELWDSARGLEWLDSRWRLLSEAGYLDAVLSDSPLPCQRRRTALRTTAEEEEENYHSFGEDLDRGDAYFSYLVEMFIAAAYPPGMIWPVATRSGQEEDAMTPSASVSGDMSELESAEADVTTRSGVAQSPQPRMVPCERWTWKHQTTEDGGLIVMSPNEKQPHGDKCMPTATKLVMESNVRVQLKKDRLVSLDNLINISDDAKRRFPGIKVGVKHFFKQIQAEGVISEDDYHNPQSAQNAVRYGIEEYIGYRVDDPNSMRNALFKLRRTGPLMGVLRISGNYQECARSGKIYKYNPNLVDKDAEAETHAVCIISFGIEDLPFLEAQSTHGEKYKDFLKIDVTSLSQLWRMVVR